MAIVVVSGPSGVGKNTVLEGVFKALPELKFGQTLTTREARSNDIPGKYEHVDEVEFKARVKRGELLEWAEVHGNFYGTKKPKVGDHIILEIDVQGAGQVKAKYPEALLILIEPPGETLEDKIGVLERRLRDRQTDSDEVIQQRLLNAEKELIDGQAQSDFVITNDSLDRAVAETVTAIKTHLR